MSTYVRSSIYVLSTVNLFLFLRWSGLLLLSNINLLLIQINTRAAVNGTPSQIPAFFTYNLYFGVKVTQNVAQYLLHNVTYAPVKFEVDMSNG